ncbi:MAG TPA: amylo-alpha-1,6-glucosidase [Armatimonadaceae bacterium]|jgi:predicted glycogen debranching enzyme|nr:amylo-alpha-1,6-glucosidase [Armatimonadaceae bacterium]
MRPLTATELTPFENAARREWLSVNGIGGFASGTVSGAASRRYHALLIAPLGNALGRMALFSKVDETLTVLESHFDLSANRYPNGVVFPDGWHYIAEFNPLPVPTWTYRMPGDTVLVKRVFLARGRNTVYVTYLLREAPSNATLTLTPLVCWKRYHDEMHPWPGFPIEQGPEVAGWSLRATPDAPRLRLIASGAKWTAAGWWHEQIIHDREAERGLDHTEDLYCPAVATVTLRVGQSVTLVGTIEESEPVDETLALAEVLAHQKKILDAAKVEDSDEAGRVLALCADAFVVKAPRVRTTIIAGFPWFTDWGRDTFVALPGLCLSTGRPQIAREILDSFAGFVSEGMIPNRFPDFDEQPEYNTVDAALWFVYACEAYVRSTGDRGFVREILPVLEQIIDAHIAGTRYGIGVDPEDGLLASGEAGVSLTWMDARIGDWTVSSREGKVVEVNALWIHALHAVAQMKGAKGGKKYLDLAARAEDCFSKFVRPDGRGLFDVIGRDGTPDYAIRPNQVIAAALPHTPLTAEQLKGVLDTATQELLTPFGLRSLSPSDPNYRPRYSGDVLHRDSSYHQGTAWAWPIGAYVDLYRRVNGADADVAPLLEPLEAQIREYGLGGIGEVFDADAPYQPDGCPWQAWSVGEVLRVRRPRK